MKSNSAKNIVKRAAKKHNRNHTHTVALHSKSVENFGAITVETPVNNKKRKIKKYIIILLCVVAMLILAIILGLKLVKKAKSVETVRLMAKELNEIIDKQQKTDADILAELNDDVYSLTDPLIVLNPYGVTPLSAVAAFQTARATKIDLTVLGKTSDTDISFAFDTYETKHLVPIYGLYANTLNQVKITATDRNNQVTAATLQIQTDPLPAQFTKFQVSITKQQPGLIQQGLNWSLTNDFAYDKNGDIRALFLYIFSNNILPLPLNDVSERNSLLSRVFINGYTFFIEHNFFGKYLNIWVFRGTSDHDAVFLPNGNLLVLGKKLNKIGFINTTMEDELVELNTFTGTVEHVTNFSKILPRNRETILVGYSASNGADWLHGNKLFYESGSIFLSARNQNLALKMSYPDGKIKWILGNHDDWPAEYQQYLLTPIGSDFEWPYAPHNIHVLPDLDHDLRTTDVMLFDNGTERPGTTWQTVYSRMVQYRVNESTMTIQQIWQYGKERGSEWFGMVCGSVQLLENGNRLAMTYQNVNEPYYSFLSEVAVNGSLVWEAKLSMPNKEDAASFLESRTICFPIYNVLDNNLPIGKQAQIYDPDGIVKITK